MADVTADESADSERSSTNSLVAMRFDAAVFDMDGLLLESESCWRTAEREASDALGLGLTDDDFRSTMGVRMRDVAKIWFGWQPWEGPSVEEVADGVVARVIELIADADPLPGVIDALDLLERRGLRLALCSSSDDALIDAAVEALGIADRFELLHSAEHNDFGKPHPDPYLSTAAKLGVAPDRCLAFEDSVNGCLSAKSAGMAVVAVPDADARGSARFGFTDVVLESLAHFDDDVLDALGAGTAIPTLSRPRFHLAFGVDDLDAARGFYGGVLGCQEGRSAATWIDFDLWGHQVVAHLDPVRTEVTTNDVDGHQVPANHFGLLLPIAAWRDLVDRLTAASVPYVMEPTVRFEGEQGEQHTCFVSDPAGNALEFKAFADDREVFRP